MNHFLEDLLFLGTKKDKSFFGIIKKGSGKKHYLVLGCKLHQNCGRWGWCLC